jgi:SOS response regulatory protein OraA/RecX
MAVITNIKPLPSDPNLRRIYVNKKAIALLRASDVELLKLREGLAWTTSIEQAVRNEHDALNARRDAMRMLGRRALSSGELLERLLRRNHSRALSERTVSELAADHWIDDAQYAREIIDRATRRKPASKQLLQAKLIARQLDPKLARDIITEQRGSSNDDHEALSLAQKRWSTMKNLPRDKAARRIAGTLARRGFDHQAITHALEQLGLNTLTLHDHDD